MEDAGVELPEVTEQSIRQRKTADYKKIMKNGIIQIGDEVIIGDNSLTKMMRARQLCSIYNPDRAAAVEDLLLQAGTEPVVIFYNWTAELDILKSICERCKDSSAYYAGTPGTAICVQYRAGAMGLNLQNGRICVFSACVYHTATTSRPKRAYIESGKIAIVFFTQSYARIPLRRIFCIHWQSVKTIPNS